MKYFIIPQSIANALGITAYRYGNAADGYLVNIGDLAVYGMEKALSEGAREVSEREATEFVNKNMR